VIWAQAVPAYFSIRPDAELITGIASAIRGFHPCNAAW
jgi:hypothetical protein